MLFLLVKADGKTTRKAERYLENKCVVLTVCLLL